MKHVLFSVVLLVAGCSSNSGPSNSGGSNSSTNFGTLSGHTKVFAILGGDSIISGASVTLIPLNRKTISGSDGAFSFDSVPPGRYEIFVRQDNLCYDTLRDNHGPIALEVDSGRITNYDALVNSILSAWDATILIDGGYIQGPLRFYTLPYVSIAYDGYNQVFGTWSLTGNALTMTIPGPAADTWKYTGTFLENQSGQTLRGQVFDGSALDPWNAKRY